MSECSGKLATERYILGHAFIDAYDITCENRICYVNSSWDMRLIESALSKITDSKKREFRKRQIADSIQLCIRTAMASHHCPQGKQLKL
jgi:hypothetical protein